MKTVDEILAYTSEAFAAFHCRPEIYVGSKSFAGAADTLHGIMFTIHSLWAWIQSRDNELQTIVVAVRKEQDCDCQDFPDAFRRKNPDADEEAVFDHVLECWAEIDWRLNIDISRTSFERIDPSKD